jgi:glyoxylase-like metal-dependent hydrolase (beta-lactamase superfamily II)
VSEEADRAEDEALALAAEAGIHRLAVPTPFMVGRVNAYLIEDSPLTLIDSGPNSEKSLQELERALGERGHRVEDLELLIVSHQHVDHFGLASVLARRSGADVAALDSLAPWLGNYIAESELDDRFAERMMIRHGIPRDTVTGLMAVSESFRSLGAPVQVTRRLQDGSEIRLRDRTLRVLHRPGHSPSDTVFLDQSRSVMLAADHLIARISSNPLLARPLASGADYDGPRPKALLTYLDSLTQTRAMNLSLVLPGHGEAILDHVPLIEERFRMHQRRAAKIGKLVEQGPRSAHEIALELWGKVATTEAYLTLSEVLGHADMLLRDGSIVELEEDGVVRFQRA